MDSKELRNLQEAYMEVVENQQQLDEGYKPLPTDRIKKKASRLAKDTLRDAGTALNPFKSASEKSAAKSNMAKRQKRVDKMVDVMKKETQKEEVDIYDIILSHLLHEGYAETSEAAEAIMVNMSEDWRDSIVLDEAEYVKFNDGRKSRVTRMRGEFKKPQPLTPLPKSSRKSTDGVEKLEKGREAFNKSREVASRNILRQKS